MSERKYITIHRGDRFRVVTAPLWPAGSTVVGQCVIATDDGTPTLRDEAEGLIRVLPDAHASEDVKRLFTYHKAGRDILAMRLVPAPADDNEAVE